jgi:hypothetical protein
MSDESRGYRPDHWARPLRVRSLALLAVIGSWSASPVGRASPMADSPQFVACAFSHPAYSGLCKQRVRLPKGATPEQACRRVLSCLNNVQCIKTYCTATTIRGGWKLESAKLEPSKE